MKFLFVRHGETDCNKNSTAMGSRIDAPLNETGNDQAITLADSLEQNFDYIVSSPLKRASQTAHCLAHKLSMDVTFYDELKERDFGSLSGLTIDEILEKLKEVGQDKDQYYKKFDFREFGGESFDDVKARLKRFVERAKDTYGDKTVMVVAHGGVIRMMHKIYSDKEIGHMGNASVHEFNI